MQTDRFLSGTSGAALAPENAFQFARVMAPGKRNQAATSELSPYLLADIGTLAAIAVLALTPLILILLQY